MYGGTNLNYSDDEVLLNSDSDDIDYSGGLMSRTVPKNNSNSNN